MSQGVLVGVVLFAGTLSGSSLLHAQEPERRDSAGQVTAEEGKFIISTRDSSFMYVFDARVQIDAAVYVTDKNELSNGTELRRGRVAIKSLFWQDWRAEVEVDVADNQLDVKDAWLSYDGLHLGLVGSGLIKVGNFKEPFSLEELISARSITFLERALPNAFAPSRHLGVAYTMWGRNWSFSSGLFGQGVGATDLGEDEGLGVTSRLTFAPVHQPAKTVHLGLGGSYRTPDADTAKNKPDRVRFRSRPEAHVDRTRFLNTGSIRDVTNFVLYGLEAAGVFRSLSVQSEYIKSHVNRKLDRPDVSFDGAYVFLSWLVTGESRPYVNRAVGVDATFGEFGRILPKRKYGAWELAVRYSTLDLNDVAGAVTGGRASNITVGLNWYANANIRVMANFVAVNNNQDADAGGSRLGDDDFKVFQARFQATF